MNNAEKFKDIFGGTYVTGIWASTEESFLKWATEEYIIPAIEDKPNRIKHYPGEIRTIWHDAKKDLPQLPKDCNEVLIIINDVDFDSDCMEIYKGFYEGGEWWTQMFGGCKRVTDCNALAEVTAWAYLPEIGKNE